MIKKYFLIIFTNLLIPFFIYPFILETERTIWIPWTPDHTQLWENYELLDNSKSQFRRNEYFEDMQTLIQRDIHWETLCNLLTEHTGTTVLFPPLGFAILDKQNNELLGTIRFNLSSKNGYFSLGYGLKTSARYQKLGSEIGQYIIQLINLYYQYPIPTLKKGISKSTFMAEWYKQAKQQDVDFAKLLDYFDKNPTTLQGLTACVDITNQSSLNILYRNGMKPIEIECTKYYVEKEPHFYCFAFLLLYPCNDFPEKNYFESVAQDILSRNSNRIQYVETLLKNIFHISHNWCYLSLNRKEKSQLKLVQAKIISTEFLSDITSRLQEIQKYEPPYCFIQ
jgi:hypothetical protein